MLIKLDEIKKILKQSNINVTGILHVGAHDCEELSVYNKLNLKNVDVIWIDALLSKVEEARSKFIPNVYHAVITDKDDENIIFNVANNNQSSSVLDFGTHSKEHPSVVYVDKIEQKSITIDTFFKRNNIESLKYNFWCFDIQGAELLALKGATESIKNVDIIYLEVNEQELYKDCGLITDIDNFLLKFNFTRVYTVMTKHGWGDAIYIKHS
jgi:FkbM family methyltransferase